MLISKNYLFLHIRDYKLRQYLDNTSITTVHNFRSLRKADEHFINI